MKRLYLTTALLLLFCGAILAQEQQPQLENSPKLKKIKDTSWKTQRPRHEFQFGIGDHTMYISGFYDEYYYYYEKDIKWFGSDVYTKTRIYTPALSATYHYRLLKWLSVGGYVSYAAIFNQKTNIITEKDISCQNHFVAIAPSVRFTYLNKKYVTLYSGLSVSMMWEFASDEDGRETWSYVTGQITAIGVTVGRKWFGFTELGYGNKGVVTAGFGYRFGSK